jgi:F420H(2)-dependent quinone reductase
VPLNGEYEPSTAQFVRDQVELYESSGGTQGTTLGVLVAREEDENLEDVPVVILTTLGAKSGKIRKSPLIRVEHDGSYAVVASAGGAPKHPVRYHNAAADPRVELQDGPVRQDMPAREVTGDEKAVWWARAVEAFPDYAEYRKADGPRDPGPRPGAGRPGALTRTPGPPGPPDNLRRT